MLIFQINSRRRTCKHIIRSSNGHRHINSTSRLHIGKFPIPTIRIRNTNKFLNIYYITPSRHGNITTSTYTSRNRYILNLRSIT